MHRDHAGRSDYLVVVLVRYFVVASELQNMQSKDDRFMQPNLCLFFGCMSWVNQGKF
jgi:hypothetical protein